MCRHRNVAEQDHKPVGALTSAVGCDGERVRCLLSQVNRQVRTNELVRQEQCNIRSKRFDFGKVQFVKSR